MDEDRFRVKFSKTDDAKWLSHLDLARYLERSIRRAGLPIAYSNGFSPHPKISFGQALSVGFESQAEYVDLTFESELEPDEVKSRLSRTSSDSIKVLRVIKLGSESRKLGKVLRYADYRILVSFQDAPADEIKKRINKSSYLTSEHVKITSEYRSDNNYKIDDKSLESLGMIVQIPVSLSPKKLLLELQEKMTPYEVIINITRVAQWYEENGKKVDPIEA